MLYPVAMRLIFEVRSHHIAQRYSQEVSIQQKEALDNAWVEAREYNARHAKNVIVDPFADDARVDAINEEYESLLNIMGNGIMGFIDIPKIGQRLTIYHGTDAPALQNGVGHMLGTSLPVGGGSSHCVLSGHRGLPSAKLFTDLDQLTTGDMIFIHVLDRVLAYRVDGAKTVLPTQIDELAIVEGEDLLTLVTCTPYAVNTHRLLVTAHFVPYIPEEAPSVDVPLFSREMLIAISCATILITLIVWRLITRTSKKRRDAVHVVGKHMVHNTKR